MPALSNSTPLHFISFPKRVFQKSPARSHRGARREHGRSAGCPINALLARLESRWRAAPSVTRAFRLVTIRRGHATNVKPAGIGALRPLHPLHSQTYFQIAYDSDTELTHGTPNIARGRTTAAIDLDGAAGNVALPSDRTSHS